MYIHIRPSFARIERLCKYTCGVVCIRCVHNLYLCLTDILPLPHSYGAERFEDGASQINKSDMFYGDDGDISDADLEHMDEVTMKNVQFVKMTEGDVVLLDNYKCMHGRNVFDGTRKHGVAWFEGWEGEEDMKKAAKSGASQKEAVMA